MMKPLISTTAGPASRHPGISIIFSLFFLFLSYVSAQEVKPTNQHLEGQLSSGATYVFDMPSNWNGTTLLFSHGHAAGPNNPARNFPRNEKDWLLANGYALIGSSYAKVGWAIEEAVPDQIATLDSFIRQFSKPRHTIAWGSSMGGLITIALMEKFPERIDGGLALCASAGGSVGMMNAALDGAFVFKTLAAPDSNLPILFNSVGEQGKADMAAWKQQLDPAQLTPQGRARIALAATLAQVPPWIDPKIPQPHPKAYVAQQEQLYKGLLGGILLPRDDQEKRAGGNFSWNTGIDYAALVARSGREDFLRALYQQAGLSLDKDLALLANASRIAAEPESVAYMKKNYVPSGNIKKPMLLVQAVADPVTLVEFNGDYAQLVRQAGHPELVRTAYVQRTGHCNFNQAESIAALLTLEQSLARGQWENGDKDSTKVQSLNRLAGSLHLDGAVFIDYHPAPFLRSCSTREPNCPGEPGGLKP